MAIAHRYICPLMVTVEMLKPRSSESRANPGLDASSYSTVSSLAVDCQVGAAAMVLAIDTHCVQDPAPLSTLCCCRK